MVKDLLKLGGNINGESYQFKNNTIYYSITNNINSLLIRFLYSLSSKLEE